MANCTFESDGLVSVVQIELVEAIHELTVGDWVVVKVSAYSVSNCVINCLRIFLRDKSNDDVSVCQAVDVSFYEGKFGQARHVGPPIAIAIATSFLRFAVCSPREQNCEYEPGSCGTHCVLLLRYSKTGWARTSK